MSAARRVARSSTLIASCAAFAACAAPNTVDADSGDALTDTSWWSDASDRGALKPGASPLTGSATFARFRFWANRGETFHIQSGSAPFEVVRVSAAEGTQFFPAGPADSPKIQTVATAVGAAHVTIAETGRYYVVIGKPTATSPVPYALSATVERRRETTGVKSVAVHGAHACAVLASGSVKCWGMPDEAAADEATVAGMTMESMGNALPASTFAKKATDVSLGYAQTSVLVEGGDVYHSTHLHPTAVHVPLDAAAGRIDGSCALLIDGRVQCWRYAGHPSATQDALVTTTSRSWPGRQVVELRADDQHYCVRFDTDEHACARLSSPASDAVTPIANATAGSNAPTLALAVTYSDDCLLSAAGIRCDPVPGLLGSHREIGVVLPSSGVRHLAMADGDSGRLVTSTGELFALHRTPGAPATYAWQRVDVGGSVSMTAAVNTAMNEFSCALLKDGRVKCFGSNGAGQLGLGDTVDRVLTESLGENLPALDLGQ